MSEMNFNITNEQKNKGNKILLSNSNFMLFHLNTMKYLHININSSEKKNIQLVDYPSDYCFFKFMPSLQLQMQRNDNFVYHEELFYICSSENESGKNLYLTVDYKKEQIEGKYLYGAIDDKKTWKLNLYELPNLDPPKSESYMDLKIGNVIWIVMSEYKYYLAANRQQDPFSKCFKKDQKNRKGKKMNEVVGRKKLGRKGAIIINQEDIVTKIKEREQNLPEWDIEINEKNMIQLKEELLENVQAEYNLIGNAARENEMIQLFELGQNGLWRIESSDLSQGGSAEYYVPYRLRHLISGKYLCIRKIQMIDGLYEYIIDLTLKKDKKSLFCFCKIENLMLKFQNKNNIHMDAYFRIQHFETKQYLGINEQEILENQEHHGGDIQSKIKIYPYQRDINTFRMRKSNFDDVWATNFLTSSIQPILDLAAQWIDVSKPLDQIQKSQQKLKIFDQIYPNFMQVLKNLKKFLTNSMLNNMVMDEDYQFPSKKRQKIFREQCLFGLICWLVSKIFPSKREFELCGVEPTIRLVSQDPHSILSDEEILLAQSDKTHKAPNTHKDKIQKLCESHLKKKIVISHALYELIKQSCFQNQQNQDYYAKVLLRAIPNVGYGDFVTNALQICIHNNNEILYNLNKLPFDKESSVFSEYKDIFSEEKNNETEDLMQNLVKRLQRFEPYSKDDIIVLLGNLCQMGDKTIYINQEKLYNSFINNRHVIFSNLLKIIYDDGQIKVEKRNKREGNGGEYGFMTLSVEEIDTSPNPQLKKYFIAQIDLYAKMCSKRNFVCGQAFKLFFPQEILMKYIQSSTLSSDTKAIFAKLFLNLYIDIDPRQIIQKPNHIRVFNEGDQIQIKPTPTLTQVPTSTSFQNSTKTQDESIKDDLQGLKDIRDVIIQITHSCYLEIIKNESNCPKATNIDKPEQPLKIKHLIFNNLTLEIVKIFHAMLKFGMFSGEKSNQALLESIIEYLSFMLEYEENYCNELGWHQPPLRRKWIENQKKQLQLQQIINLNVVNNVGGGILKNFHSIAVMLGLAQEGEDEEKERIKINVKHIDTQHNQGFTKMYEILLKLIQQYQNKTFTKKVQKIEVQKTPEIQIKIEICKIFNYLLDWREEFYLDNVMSYFNKFYSLYSKSYCPQYMYPNLLPFDQVKVGELVKGIKNFTYYTQDKEIKDFDRIIKRPFQEVLLFSFYFSSDSELSNQLISLIYKYNSQKSSLLNNLDKISLVQSSNKLYQKLSKSVGRLNALHSYCQSWLQIIEQNKYDEKAEDNLDVTSEKLQELKDIWDKSDEQELIQKIFGHINGHDSILYFLEIGTGVLEQNYKYFDTITYLSEGKQECPFSYKFVFIKKLQIFFNNCHQILIQFCQQNKSIQKLMIRIYEPLIYNQNYINIGQVELICVLLGNYKNCNDPIRDTYLNYIINLIRTHGHYHQFLEPFQIVLKQAQRKENINIIQNLLQLLMKTETIQELNPFYDEKIDEVVTKIPFYMPKNKDLYKSLFIIIITQLIKNASVSWITRAHDELPVTCLIKVLHKEVKQNEISQKKYEIKNFCCDLMMIYFNKLEKSHQEIIYNEEKFQKILELETDKLQLKYKRNDYEIGYMLQHFLPLVNFYCLNFLKDSILISIMSLQDLQGFQTALKVYRFAESLISNIDKFINIQDFQDFIQNDSQDESKQYYQIYQNFNIICKCFKLTLPFTPLNKKIDTKFTLKALVKKVTYTILKGGKQSSLPIPLHNFQINWNIFKKQFQSNPEVIQRVKDESKEFIKNIIQIDQLIENPDEAIDNQLLLRKEDFITRFLDYLEFWKERSSDKQSALFVIKIISYLIIKGSDDQENNQNLFDSLNCTRVIMQLFWNESQHDKVYMYYLLKVLVALLDGGNTTIQSSIYKTFITDNQSEKFFKQIFLIIKEEINVVNKSGGTHTTLGTKTQGKNKPIIELLLKFLQLLCQGHNSNMQNYLRKQENSKISYDLVSLIIQLITQLKVSNHTNRAIQQSLTTLIELVKGPYTENQLVLSQSKFLEWAVNVLGDDPKQFEWVDIQISDKIKSDTPSQELKQRKKNQIVPLNISPSPNVDDPDSLDISQMNPDTSIFLKKSQPQLIQLEIPLYNPTSQVDKEEKKEKKTQMNINYSYLIRIKHQCVICILILLEMPDPVLGINTKLRRTIPNQVLVSNLITVYKKYYKQNQNKYQQRFFNQINKVIDENKTNNNDYIIEMGFNILAILNILYVDDLGATLNPEQEEIRELILEQNQINKKNIQGILGDLSRLSSNTIKSTAVNSKELTLTKSEKEEKNRLEKLQKFKKLRAQTFSFFSSKLVSIEIMRAKSVTKVYFPLLPFCQLSKQKKDDFHDGIDVNDPKGKLRAIMTNSVGLIKSMQHEHRLKRIFESNFLLSFIVSNQDLWGNLVFAINCFLNFVILTSYSDYNGPDGEDKELKNEYIEYIRNNPHWFESDNFDWTKQLIFIITLLNVILSSIVVSIFFIKRAPLILNDMWIQWYNSDVGNKIIKVMWFFVTLVKSVQTCLMDFEFVFYTTYIIFCILGLAIHPFFVSYGLICDFLRIKILKNVIKAVWIPRESLFLTFLVFILAEYYFSIVAYIQYSDQFEEGTCDQLWRCTLRVFDFTFKEGGAVGSFMQNDQFMDVKISPIPQWSDGEVVGVENIIQASQILRIIYDNLFVWILPVLLISMVAGIIIDTFGALKHELNVKEDNYQGFCFICTFDREIIDKSYDLQDGFQFHIKKHHYLWNYIFFKAYLDFKNKNEYSSNETFVANKFRTLDISWFPYRKSIIVQDGSAQQEQRRDQKMELISKFNQDLTQEITTLQIRCQNIMND